MKFKVLISVCCIFSIWQCTKDQMPLNIEFDNMLKNYIGLASPDNTVDFYILPDETDLVNIPQDPKNPLTPEKVALGKFLFYDTGLGRDALKADGMETYSCSTCHIAEAGFRPGTFQGIADGGEDFGITGEDRRRNTEYSEAELDVQSARPLSMLNVAYVENTFWNGQFGAGDANEGITEFTGIGEDLHELNALGFKGIETQNLEGIHTHRITINKEILDEFGYTPMFDEVFADVDVSERYTADNASFALSAYIRTILANQAPFQSWLKGNTNAMTVNQKKGAILFFSKAQCFQCHYEENLGSAEFHALGVNDMDQYPGFNTSPEDLRNLGRYSFTNLPEDMFKFKVPQLYNMIDTKFYFHGASKKNLRSVVEYKLEAQSENPRIGNDLISTKLNKVNLSEEEINSLLDFIENGLRDPNLNRYKPNDVPSGNCFPNNDPLSVSDLGCG